MPDAFSPNNDGVNDELSIFVSKPKLFLMKIYNRYGELVFQTDDYAEKWNGTYKNVPCPLDSYVYTIEIESFNNERLHKNGVVQLLR